METSAAMRLVRGGCYPEDVAGGKAAFLQSILFSEMEDEATRDCSEGPLRNSGHQTRLEPVKMAKVWRSEGTCGTRIACAISIRSHGTRRRGIGSPEH